MSADEKILDKLEKEIEKKARIVISAGEKYTDVLVDLEDRIVEYKFKKDEIRKKFRKSGGKDVGKEILFTSGSFSRIKLFIGNTEIV